ncbi:hypothetical protein Y032_0109g112 [Ancylostoma ceylanicum]|nr:hypothetical protein Y032_0109g112 [Ancylostoma ceylanicum]
MVQEAFVKMYASMRTIRHCSFSTRALMKEQKPSATLYKDKKEVCIVSKCHWPSEQTFCVLQLRGFAEKSVFTKIGDWFKGLGK